ncbi:hypothetical protein L873DRAFT_1787377 [Choiromyces venosus 120613-1]|uniref:Biogenesis of lysosome-related organelles complex 1 subunit CNL1 n=1 Tax=Choiromyces venosus 120613-1 TaxID=1336337 RepID=A0A3N4JX44_9PEZI|nr:hypothetical protein L873DRAFT_1787377 [Choiromyces venosus 120613-1]
MSISTSSGHSSGHSDRMSTSTSENRSKHSDRMSISPPENRSGYDEMSTSSDHPSSSTGREPTIRDLGSKINMFHRVVNTRIKSLQDDWDSKINILHKTMHDYDGRHRQFEVEVNNQFAEVNNQFTGLSNQLVLVLNRLEGPRTMRALVVID